MFDFGMQELIVIFIVALLVFGPKRLPELGRALGKGIGELKRALQGVKDSIDEAETHIEKGVPEETKTNKVSLNSGSDSVSKLIQKNGTDTGDKIGAANRNDFSEQSEGGKR